jgi:hypothetical protein
VTATWNRRRFEPLAAFGVREQLSPEEKVYLHTSPIMHKRLASNRRRNSARRARRSADPTIVAA